MPTAVSVRWALNAVGQCSGSGQLCEAWFHHRISQESSSVSRGRLTRRQIELRRLEKEGLNCGVRRLGEEGGDAADYTEAPTRLERAAAHIDRKSVV